MAEGTRWRNPWLCQRSSVIIESMIPERQFVSRRHRERKPGRDLRGVP